MSLLLDKLKKTQQHGPKKKLLLENKNTRRASGNMHRQREENIYAREKIVYERDRQK